MGGLGSLKMHGKLDPKIMAMSMLPHARFGNANVWVALVWATANGEVVHL